MILQYKNRSLATAIFASALFALVSCNTSVNTIQTPERTGRNVLPIEKIIMNPGLNADLRVDNVKEKMSGDLWTVQVDITNITGSDIEYQYRFEWLDPQGFVVHTPSSTWLPRKAHAGETVAIQGVAPQPNIADFRMKVTQLDR